MPRKPAASRSALFACVAAATLVALLPRSAGTQPISGVPPSASAAPALLGVELPTLGGGDWWSFTRKQYFTPENLADVRNNLHATYVRTGWIPGRLQFEKFRWRREDDGMKLVCGSGLQMMIIVPSPKDDDGEGESSLLDNVREFFARYTASEPGCIRYAEVGNESDLPENGFTNVGAYAAYYRKVAPIVASFGIPVITSGVSGKDVPWTFALARLLHGHDAPVSGYGFHPYGIPASGMADATLAVANAADVAGDGSVPTVYVTEIGKSDANELYNTILNLAFITPTITIYEYRAQPNEDARYGLKNNPALYRAVQRAWETLHPSRTSGP